MNLLSQGMTASTEISILRNNSSVEKSSQSIARFKKQQTKKKNNNKNKKQQTIEHYPILNRQNKDVYTLARKKKTMNQNINTSDLFVERAVIFCVLYVFQVFKIE